MIKNVKNRIILLYLLFALMVFILYTVLMERNFFITIESYQKETLATLDEIINRNLENAVQYLDTFLEHEYKYNNIEDYYHDEDKLKRYLEKFQKGSKFTNTIFVYFEDGRAIFSDKSLNKQIYGMNEYKRMCEDVKRYGKILITDSIKIEQDSVSGANGVSEIAYIMKPLYDRSGKFVGTANIAIDNYIITSLLRELNVSRLYSDLKIYFKNQLVYESHSISNLRTITNTLVNREHNIKYVMKNILYEKIPGFEMYITCKKIILVLLLTSIIFMMLVSYYVERNVITNKNFGKLYNMSPGIVATFVIAIYISAAAFFYTVYLKFNNIISENNLYNVNVKIANYEKNDFENNVILLKYIANNIEEDIKEDSEENAKEKLKTNYNDYINNIISKRENIVSSLIILNDSTYSLIPNDDQKYNIRYRNTWTNDEYFADDIYFIDSYNFGENSKSLILTPIIHNDKEIGVLTFNFENEKTEYRLTKFLGENNFKTCIYQDRKLYEVDKDSMQKKEILQYDISEVTTRTQNVITHAMVKCKINNTRKECVYFHLRLLNKTIVVYPAKKWVTQTGLFIYFVILLTVVVITISFLYSSKMYKTNISTKEIVDKIIQKKKVQK